MSGVYILNGYGKLSKQSDHLMYEKSTGEKSKILLNKMEMLVLPDHISITGESFRLLSEYKIPVYIMEKGVQNIKIDFGLGKNGFLRQRQYHILDNFNESLEVAKSIVEGKIKNQITFLQNIERSKDVDISKQIIAMKGYIKSISGCEDKNKLRGLEGITARNYFDLFDLNLNSEWAVFGTRSQHPPKTNVNALLSFLYSLLMCKVHTAIEAEGLDVMCSNLHEMTYGKNTLVFDLMEEFRTPIADRLCCSLINHNVLKAEDFCDVDDAVYLTTEGKAKVITAFEEKMEMVLRYDPTDENLSYFQIIFEQIKAYKRFILGEAEKYIPYQMK